MVNDDEKREITIDVEALSTYEVGSLNDFEFRVWVYGLLAMRSLNGSVEDNAEKMAWTLHSDEVGTVRNAIEKLVERGLWERSEGEEFLKVGSDFKWLSWAER